MYTICHELRHARKAWPGTLVDPFLLSGQKHRCIAIYIWEYSIRKFLED